MKYNGAYLNLNAGVDFSIEDVARFIDNGNIRLVSVRTHLKATEQYLDVIFDYPDDRYRWNASIPFQYRRLGLFLEAPEEIAG